MKFEAKAAFFYPQDSKDPPRIQRAKVLGLNAFPNEYSTAQTTNPLFPGHDQPRVYSLDGSETVWEDTDPKALGLHIELAQDAKLTCFFIDTFQGCINGVQDKELAGVVNELIKLDSIKSGKFQFANFAIIGRSRVQFPLPLDDDGTYEPGRTYDLGPDTAARIVDVQHKFWESYGYLKLNDKPVLGIYIPRATCKNLLENPQPALDFIHELKVLALKKYQTEPYLVGTILGPKNMDFLAKLYCQSNIDALTSYAFLPNWGRTSFIQDYTELVKARIQDWQKIISQSTVPFWPSAVTGWDACSRGERGLTRQEVEGFYPFHPVVQNATPEAFGMMLESSLNAIKRHCPEGQRVSVVCAWNEVGEGMTMIPRLIDGKQDKSILEIHKKVILASENIA